MVGVVDPVHSKCDHCCNKLPWPIPWCIAGKLSTIEMRSNTVQKKTRTKISKTYRRSSLPSSFFSVDAVESILFEFLNA